MIRASELLELKRRCIRWAADNSAALRTADPVLPAQVHGRDADNVRPFAAIADLVGGDWPEKIRAAAAKLIAPDAGDTLAITILVDLRKLFADRGVDRLTSAEIIEVLVTLEDKPWAEIRGGRPLTVNGLAKLLDNFKIKPRPHRFGMRTLQGYELSQFVEAFDRYLPDPGLQTATPQQINNGAASEEFQSTTLANDVALQKPMQPNDGVGCCGVVAQEPTPSATDESALAALLPVDRELADLETIE